MKKKLLVFLLVVLSTVVLGASPIVTTKERKELKDEFKMYRSGSTGRYFYLKNKLGKREIVIAKKTSSLPQSSSTAFGEKDNDRYGDWELRKNRKGIQYMGVDKTARRKAIKKIENRYVVLFYTAIGNNDEMVDDTLDDVEKILKRY